MTAHYFQAASNACFIEKNEAFRNLPIHVSKGKQMNEVILHKLLSGQASEADKSWFEQWISEDVARIACFEKMKLIWTLAGENHRPVAADTDNEWRKLQKRLEAIPTTRHDEAKLVSMPRKPEIVSRTFIPEAAVC